jgi:general secretion pathway protein D
MPIRNFVPPAFMAIALLSGCAPSTMDRDSAAPPRAKPMQGSTLITQPADGRAGAGDAADSTKIFKGTGQLVKGQLAGGALPAGPAGAVANGPAVTLNFEGADLREVVRNILSDILGESYTIDPTVGGTVTIRTTAGIPREALPATLEMLLRSNGAAMVKENGIWKVIPAATVLKGNVTPQLGNSTRVLPPGYSVQIVPLRYIGARQMATVLEPFLRDATNVRVDDLRNMLILSGTEFELRHLLETIDMFDVNWVAGMSVGLFTLQSADVKTVMSELDKALGTPDKSPLGGLLRIIPIERMNALLVVTPQPAYLDEAKKWIERLDKGGEGSGVRFYVYQVQNSRAERIGPLLQQAFTGRAQQAATAGPPTLAPGTPAGTIVSPPAYQSQAPTQTPSGGTTGASGATNTANAAVTAAQAQVQAAAAARAVASGDGIGVIRNIQVVSDKDNNTILIVATPTEYSVIEAALKKLDVPQRQVVIEVTIAEVVLTDDLQFGVEWLFKGGAPSGRGSGGLFNQTSPFNPAVPTTTTTPTTGGTPVNSTAGLALSAGFNYLLNSLNFPGGIQAALHLLDNYGNVKVISNPHLSALDNQKATIKVGDRIPICQQTYVGAGTVGTVNNAVTTTSSYIDTGVLLQVTPHVNAGGLVTLEVQAEVSVAGTTANPCDAPPINTRSVQTLLAVPSGQTMVMGGLILEDKENSSAGLPLLARIPVLGGLFGNQELKNNRTELVLFITPRVVENEADYRSVIDNLRRRMEQIDDLFPPPQTAPQGSERR